MRTIPTGLFFLLLLAGGLPAAAAEGKSAFDKPTLEAFTRHLLLWGPQIKVSISDPVPSELEGFSLVRVRGSADRANQDHFFYISKDGKQVVRASILEIDKNPFHKDFEKITTSSQPSLGKAGAPVRMVIFTDFQCPYCRQEAELLRANLIKEFPDQVRLYLKDYPLTSIHPWSKAAAMAGRCVYAQSEDGFWKYHDWVFSKQSEFTAGNIRDKVIEFAGTLPGTDILRLTSCVDTKETESEVDQSIAEARSLGLNSTPTLFINGRKITRNLTWPKLKQIIEFELNYQKTAHDAGDIDCCALTLPTPLAQ